MYKTGIFSREFVHRYADNEQIKRLVEQVELKLKELMEAYGVSTWQELPEEVLEDFEVKMELRARNIVDGLDG